MRYVPHLVLLIIAILLMTPAGILIQQISANPVPIDYLSGGTPVPANSTSIYLRSENVTVTLSDTANVVASYIFKNSDNATINQTIYLPFYMQPTDLQLFLGDTILSYTWATYHYGHTDLPAAEFNLSFERYEEKTMTTVYEREYNIYSDWYTYNLNYEYIYLSETGKEWNHTIEKAIFTFNIQKELCSTDPVSRYLGLIYNTTTTDEYVVATVEFINWTPTQNIDITWSKYRFPPLAYLSASPLKVNKTEEVVFDASESTDIDGNITQYYFEFGDGTSTGWVNFSTATHTYQENSIYYARVKVKDNDDIASDWSNKVMIVVGISQSVSLTDNNYLLIEIIDHSHTIPLSSWNYASSNSYPPYTIHPNEQLLDGRMDFNINTSLKIICAGDEGLQGFYSLPYSTSAFDIVEVKSNGRVSLVYRCNHTNTSMTLDVLDVWTHTDHLLLGGRTITIINYGIWSKSRIRAWGTPTRITTNSSYDEAPSLIQDMNEKYWVAWDSDYSGDYDIYLSSSVNGINWGDPVLLSINSDTSSEFDPCLMQDKSGKYWLAWKSNRGSSCSNIWLSSSNDCINWSTPTKLSINSDSANDFNPFLMQDNNGKYWLVFGSYRTGNIDIWYTSSNDGVNWNTPIQLDTNPLYYEMHGWTSSSRPKMIQDKENIYWIIWDSESNSDPTWWDTSGSRSIWYSRSNNGVEWSIPEKFDLNTEYTYNWYASFTQDADGIYWLAWRGDSNLLLSYSHDCINWSTPIPLPNATYSAPSLLIDSNGSYWLAYGWQDIQFLPFTNLNPIPEEINWNLPDTISPTVVIMEQGQEVNINTFTMHWSTDANDLKYYEVRINDEGWVNVGTSTYYTFILSKGANTLYVRGIDTAGTVGTADSITVIYKSQQEKKGFIPGFGVAALITMMIVSVIMLRRKQFHSE